MKFNWDDNPDLNITPFVDVMLVLMAILMVTAPTMTYEEQVDLPQGTQTKEAKKLAEITIRMEASGRISLYVNGKKRDSYSTIRDFRDNFMLKSNEFNLNSTVYIDADKSLIYEKVMELLKSVKDVGFTKASLITL